MNDIVLVLHGMVMSGASMLSKLGPLRSALEECGLSLVAPNGAHEISAEDISGLRRWARARAADRRHAAAENAGQTEVAAAPSEELCEDEENDGLEETELTPDLTVFDWFRSQTDPGTKRKTYHSLEASLRALDDAITGQRVVGMIGFSQGAALAVILASLAAAGDRRFDALRFGVFIGGFKPTFDTPTPPAYPIASTLSRLYVIGQDDPIFPGGEVALRELATAFEGGTEKLLCVKGLGHAIPRDSATVAEILNFVRSARGVHP
jgi:predicted esterase